MPANDTRPEPANATPAAAATRPSGPRVPTLCRLVCQAFEAFLTDRADDPRLPGLIPRSMIVPWWDAIVALCGDELVRFDLRLKTIVGTGEFEDANQLAVELQRAAINWTMRILTAIQQPSAIPAVDAVASNKLLVEDIREVARILAIAAPLRSQLALTGSLLAEEGQMEGRRIFDLMKDSIVMLRQQYQTFAEVIGPDAVYFALALANRMVRPWQIILVARGLAWRPRDHRSRYPEFDIVAQRLILELKRTAGEIVSLTRKDDTAGQMAAIKTMTVRYFDGVNGLITAFGPMLVGQDDAAWNASGEAHTVLSAVFDRAFNDRVTALVLRADETGLEAAVPAAEFVGVIIENGPLYGFANEARDYRERLGTAIEAKANAIVAEMRGAPNPAAQARLYALLRAIETMFKDPQGVQLARNLRMSRQISAA
ncbi:MAG TPA: hypothetical protein VEU53_10735 [Stellaceae bacterium]|nr:hypothetical protein [Stellaceae bacterium]